MVEKAASSLFVSGFSYQNLTSEESPMLLARQSRTRRCTVLNSYEKNKNLGKERKI